MSTEFDNIGAWVLKPYCFCANREWLTVDTVNYIENPGDSGGSKLETASGLSPNDAALLAALILASALFLFLIYLLTCCLCPYGLCCGRRGFCCTKSKTGHKAAGHTGNGKVNLTAVDMKIPRPWTTDSENVEGAVVKDINHSYGKKGESYLKEAYSDDEGWFSTSELDSLYGENDRRSDFAKDWMASAKRKFSGEMISMDKYYGNKNSISEASTRLRNKSFSTTDIETLMTPKQEVSFSLTAGRGGGAASSGQSSQQVSYAVTTLSNSESNVTSDSGLSSNSMNAVTEISVNGGSNQALQQGLSRSVPPSTSYTESYVSTNGNIRTLDDASFNNNGASVFPQHNVITEVCSTYKRQVIEETEMVIE